MLTARRVLLLFLVLTTTRPLAQSPCSGSFSGNVTDGSAALPGAVIILTPGDLGQVTDVNGHFHFDRVCFGTYHVLVKYLGFSPVEFEQQIAGETSKVIIMSQELKKLEEVVIQGQHVEKDNGLNSVTLSGTQLAEAAGKTLGEALREVPGVSTIQAGPGIFKPVIHGVHSQRILILNHGIRLEGQQWGAEHAPEVDPFVASEMIVIKDAASIKYGTDALGGVIVVNPPALPVKAKLGGAANTVFQSNGRSATFSGMLEGGRKGHDGWGWRVQGTARRAGDSHAASYLLTNTGVREIDFSTATGYHGKDFGAEVFFSHFRTELGILKGTAINNQDDLVAAMEREPPQNTSSFSYRLQEPRQEVAHSLLKLSAHKQRPESEWSIQYGFQDNARREFDLRGLGVSSRTPAIDLRLLTHTLEGEWETFHFDKNSLCFGANGMIQDNDNVPGTQRIPFIPNFTSFSVGPFAVSKFFFDHWTADLGVRYDFRSYDVSGFDFKNTLYRAHLSFNNVSATAGVAVRWREAHSWSFNLSSAWRPPHVAELYSLGTHQSAASIEYGLLLNDSTNEVMDIRDVPFGIEQAVKGVSTYRHEGEKLELEATVFSNFIFNYIYLRPTGVTRTIRGVAPSFRYTQTDALFAGLDLSGVWKVGERLAFSPKASLLRAYDVAHDDFLVFIPPNRVELGVRYEETRQVKLKGLMLESKLKYTARQFRAPRVITVGEINGARENGSNAFADDSNFDFMAAPGGYVLLNLSAGYSVGTERGKYELRISAENALNASYREYTNRFRYYADDLGRNFIITAKYTF